MYLGAKSVAPTKGEIELGAGLTKDAVIQAIQKAVLGMCGESNLNEALGEDNLGS